MFILFLLRFEVQVKNKQWEKKARIEMLKSKKPPFL